ncbi:MAG: DNA replication/repair protein RecF [Actinomycetes bacterium]
MIVKHLELVDFRNHSNTNLDFQPGTTILVGQNGQGKTNLVEAIRFISTLGSHRVAGYLPLIQNGKPQAVIRALVGVDNREVSVELELNREGQNRASVNRSKSNKFRDVLGLVTTVTFAPEDLDIVKRDRSNRRDFVDELVIQAIPRLAGIYSDYNRVLKQRNSLLKSARQTKTTGTALSTLDAWDEQLVKLGSEIIANRVALIAKLEPYVYAAYQAIATSNNEPKLTIESSVLAASFDEDEDELPSLITSDRDEIEAMFHAKLAEVRKKELERGLTLIGPQRDELRIELGAMPAKGYASHGESWSLALALRLGSVELLKENGNTGDPILILDDVFAELDDERRSRLAQMVKLNEQVLITAAVANDVPSALKAQKFKVTRGVVTVG